MRKSWRNIQDYVWFTSQQFRSVSYIFNSQNHISGSMAGSTVFGSDLHLSQVLHWTQTRSSSGGTADTSGLLFVSEALAAAEEDLAVRLEVVTGFSCSISVSSSSAPWEDSAPWALRRFRSLCDFERPWLRIILGSTASNWSQRAEEILGQLWQND